MNKVLIFSVFKVLIDTKISLQKSTKNQSFRVEFFIVKVFPIRTDSPLLNSIKNIKIYQIEY